MVYAIILAGGRGERFWPKSRRVRPKQILPLISERTMLEETVERILPIVPSDNIMIVATSALGNKIKKILPGVGQLLLEPTGRNTAPAIAYTAFYLYQRDPDATMICLPADHYIDRCDRFLETIKKAIDISQDGWLVTFGITPTRPDTGYGYIEIGEGISESVFKVKKFREKPTKKKATEFIKAGRFLWNSGMFVWKAKSIIDQFKKHTPYIAEKLFNEKLSQSELISVYRGLSAISIDYAVMERSKIAAVLKGDFLWDDVGSWLSLERLLGMDENKNTIVGKTFLKDSKNCILSNDSGITALLGVSDLIVVHTKDVLFISKKTHIDRLKNFLGEIEEDEEMKKYL
ncbi:mannose-1-phosphate guanylyltransferase [candidate division WOR-3 bacterium]|nr:mannose-1-phosphate guanylyltransferase [candidate division WOR-3 bacterium]